ncbi:hypothetical protein FB565_006899 [Actinoplanes lutulentus]|uniref:Uncharacterized protein n=1 Tax=Actinoplanes lutulentus TaxID=1287878 RepID=A0A327YUJ8_9ACTN|nr:hypothetical protein [Actinoplanes lutulentus]MBB2947131.1 hypothetical protein [Actinoplanes lutulentus]RAK24663.1 hypothetical protein B0I29_1386 [Actinoplanes lutulentus]
MSTYGGRHVLRDSWIPVERRWLGLDRRTLLPGLVVIAIALLLRTAIPAIDQAIPVDNVITAGDRINLNDGLTIAPPTGWDLTDGILVGANTVEPGAGSPSASFGQGGIAAQIQVAKFAGDANALLDQVNRNDSVNPNRPEFTVTGQRATVTATGGLTGVAEDYTSASHDGILAAYTLSDGRGVAIEVIGTANQLAAQTAQITAMLRSVSFEEQP